MWLGLRNKAEKLAKGEMTIEEYIMKSKRRYLKGETKIAQKSEEIEKREIIERIVKKQEIIAEQKAEISRLNSQKREL